MKRTTYRKQKVSSEARKYYKDVYECLSGTKKAYKPCKRLRNLSKTIRVDGKPESILIRKCHDVMK